jgi:hypothetical protein
MKKILSTFVVSVFIFGALVVLVKAANPFITSIAINPELDISYFGRYEITADINESPNSVTVDVSGVNGEGSAYWDYYVDGTPVPEQRTKTLTYDGAMGKWVSEKINPDDIYPEIYFAPSSVTWNNTSSNIPIRKDSYQIFHIQNSFKMVPNMSFFIEINAAPSSYQNSQEMNVYLVKNNMPLSFFESNWTNNPEAELVASIGRNQSYHHTHNENATHFLIPLQANANGNIGANNLDVSSDFWIVLYSNSPDEEKGWQLRYNPSNICNNNNAWYIGQRNDWLVTPQEGCPQVHFHIARRETISDGVRAIINADGITSSRTFYFAPTPNLAPNSTSFLTPTANQVIDANTENTVQITWDPVQDPNNDSLFYNLYLISGEDSTQIASHLTETSFNWDITQIAEGSYGLKGSSCDNASPSLCTDFLLENFEIKKNAPVYSLSDIQIVSNNSQTDIAKAGDTITLTFVSAGDISETLNVEFFSGGKAAVNTITKNNEENSWTASYLVSSSDSNGSVNFVISADNLDQEYSETTNNSFVVIESEEGSTGGSGSGNSGGSGSGSGNSGGSGTINTEETIIENNSSGTDKESPVSVSTEPVKEESEQVSDEQKPVIEKYLFQKNLRLGMVDKDVLELQKYLNNQGYILAKDGPGSLGKETEIFGQLTKTALIKLQENNIEEILKPWGLIKGTGFCGQTTRNFLNK